jgi:hypothetical protein
MRIGIAIRTGRMVWWRWWWLPVNVGNFCNLDTVLALVPRLVCAWGLTWVLLLPQLDQATHTLTPHACVPPTPHQDIIKQLAPSSNTPASLLIALTPTWLQLSPRVHIEGHSATSWGKRELLEPVESSSCWCYVIISSQSAVGPLQRAGFVGNVDTCPDGQIFWEIRRKRGNTCTVVM